MDSYLLINLIGNSIYTTFFVIFICGRDDTMTPWWVTIIAASVPAVLTCLATLYISRKSQINKNTSSLKKIARQMGLNNKQTLSKSITDKFETISDNIGKSANDKTLTGQHKDLQDLLQKEINIAERRYIEEENRIRNFTSEQHDMAKTITEFRLFMDSWTRMSADMNKLNFRIQQLEQELSEQVNANEKLKNHVSFLEKENKILKSQYNQRSDNEREL